jgi:mannose-6-phosphate isomerase-like protein (cupin superfamily)
MVEMDRPKIPRPKGYENYKFPFTVKKPWGKEVWLELWQGPRGHGYCYKRIYIKKGTKTSFQYHNRKIETNYIIKGKAEVWLENNLGNIIKKKMGAGESFTVVPKKKHRVIALNNVILQEVSTPDVDDVIRLQDDAERGDGRIDSEHRSIFK